MPRENKQTIALPISGRFWAARGRPLKREHGGGLPWWRSG